MSLVRDFGAFALDIGSLIKDTAKQHPRAAFAAAVVGVASLIPAYHYFDADPYDVNVTNTFRDPKTDYFVVETKDANTGEIRVFRNEDSFTGWKFNSRDIQAQLNNTIGKQPVHITADGFRWKLPGPLSKIKNIITVEELPSMEAK